MYYGGMGMGNTFDNITITILVMYLVTFVVLICGSLISFVIRGFGLYKLGKVKEKRSPWMAFIPYARTYFQGELCGEIALKKKTIKNPGVWMILVPIVRDIIMAVIGFVFWMAAFISALTSTASGYYSGMDGEEFVEMAGRLFVFGVFIAIFLTAFSAVIKVLRILVNRRIYEGYTVTNMAIIHAVLGVFLPFYESVCLLIFGRRAEIEKEQQEHEQYTTYEESVSEDISE